MDAIICNFKVRYFDPVAICESLHAGPKWMKDDDDYCWHLLMQTDKSAKHRCCCSFHPRVFQGIVFILREAMVKEVDK